MGGAIFDLNSQDPTRGVQGFKEAESRIRSVVDHVIDGIVTIEVNGRIESFNPAAEKLFGYSAAEVLGRNVRMLMPSPYHEAHDGYIENYLRTGEARIIGIGREVIGQRKDMSTFPMDLAVSEFQFQGQRYFTGIIRDISERKRAEQERRDADRRKDEFLAMLAHELRNPLSPIRTGLELLAFQEVEPEVVGLMREQVEHLSRLVDDLLDVSRIMRGKIHLRTEPIDLMDIVRRAVRTVEEEITARRQQLTVTSVADPVWILADPVRLTQVVSNLLNNAVKYTGAEGRIELTIVREGDQAVLTVQDNGTGMDADLLRQAFDLFTQGDRSLERSEGGLGIGLTVVKSLVEMHQGSVAAFSGGLGQGSSFVVRLPILDSVDLQESKPRPASRTASRRILVVDDNVATTTLRGRLLAKLGNHEIRTAHDGPTALELAEEFEPEIIMLDIGLPKMSGYDVAGILRSRPKFRDTLLVAVTGYGTAEDRFQAEQAGFDVHLVKPTSLDALQQVLSHPKLTSTRVSPPPP